MSECTVDVVAIERSEDCTPIYVELPSDLENLLVQVLEPDVKLLVGVFSVKLREQSALPRPRQLAQKHLEGEIRKLTLWVVSLGVVPRGQTIYAHPSGKGLVKNEPQGPVVYPLVLGDGESPC